MEKLTSLEFKMLSAFYEINKPVTKKQFLHKYPDFKKNSVYVIFDRLTDKGYLETNFILMGAKKRNKIYNLKYSIVEFYSSLFGSSTVNFLVSLYIKEKMNYKQSVDFLKMIRESDI
ncbi:hypothetical protein [Enterococcus sp. AZ012]|uniref:hypothetical protein n=1 Tax=unclassified Enterococcus TaxID=2608891 RepID=UPI003D274752